MQLVIVLSGLCLICRFHWDWRSNRCLYYDYRVKILDRSLKQSVTLFGKRYHSTLIVKILRYSDVERRGGAIWLFIYNLWKTGDIQKRTGSVALSAACKYDIWFGRGQGSPLTVNEVVNLFHESRKWIKSILYRPFHDNLRACA